MCRYLPFSIRTAIVFLITFCYHGKLAAQWGETQFGNEWIDYKKQYLRIQVINTGIQKIAVSSLPEKWKSTDPGTWQLWHRGKEVTIIRADNKEIIFFGETNNGASDSLVHFPSAARLNPYVSLFSDQGCYFLTTSPASVTVTVANNAFDSTNPAISYHLRKDTVLYKTQFSAVTWGPGADLNHSYYDQSNSWTGPTIVGPNATPSSELPRELNVSYTLSKWHDSPEAPKPFVEMLFNGLFNGAHDIQISSGNKKLLGKAAFNGWGGKKAIFELSKEDIPDGSTGSFNIRSVSTSQNDWFGLSYFTIVYPQKISMDGRPQKEFQLPKMQKSGAYSLTIDKGSQALEVYDITDPYRTSVVKGSSSESEFMCTINIDTDVSKRLFAVNPDRYHVVSAQLINEVDLRPVFLYDQQVITSVSAVAPQEYDYIIVTNDTLKAGAIEYARYRSSSEGGNHRAIVMSIRNIYDQFNYGEPSPVAIRMFIKYMLSKGIRTEKHYLFLMGMAITYPPYLRKELPNEVPSFGDPGSDNLLVAGLNGVHKDLQAIPVGRLKAYNSSEVRAYLSKVKSYEHESTDISWRKNILHLSGGHSSSEIVTLKNILSNLEPIVAGSDLGGQVSKVVKTTTVVEKVDISNLVNEGVGMISYFGHGAATITDLDFGYASDASRGYRNLNRYPLMYFNGCGVGNIFTSRSVHILSDDWLLAPDKGAIAIIANSYLSYVTPSAKHISQVYKSLFENDKIKSIGHVLRDANLSILNNNPNDYDKANMHQATLQGDPALYLLRSDTPDYIIDSDDGVKLYSQSPAVSIKNSSKVRIGVAIRNGGKALKGVTIPLSLTLRYKNGTSQVLKESISGMPYSDTLWVSIDKDEQISLIEVKANPEEILDEFSYKNNYAELEINWDNMGTLNVYPGAPLRDLVPPAVSAVFRGSPAKAETPLSALSDIRIWVQDDRSLPADTDLIDIYIKPCWDSYCDFEPLSSTLELAEGEDSRSFAIKISDAQDLPAGKYELMVIARDRAGNTSSSPYTIKFSLGDTDSILRVKVSPNPVTSNYARFELEGSTTEEVSAIECIIYNARGQEINRQDFTGLNPTREWYWRSTDTFGTGIYVYRVNVSLKSGGRKSLSGKLIINH